MLKREVAEAPEFGRGSCSVTEVLRQFVGGSLHRVSVGRGAVVGPPVDEVVVGVGVGNEFERVPGGGRRERARSADEAAVNVGVRLPGEHKHRHRQVAGEAGYVLDKAGQGVPGDYAGDEVGLG
jgi:hypothetical protein